MFVTEIALSAVEKQKVYSFRYSQYVERLKKIVPGIDHQKKIVYEPHDAEAEHYVVYDPSGEIFAALTVTPFGASGFDEEFRNKLELGKWFSAFSSKSLVLMHQLVISPEIHNAPFLQELVFFAFEKSISSGVECFIIYCEPNLIRLFEKMGFRRYTDKFCNISGNIRIPIFLLTDPRYVKQINSVLKLIYQKNGIQCEGAYRPSTLKIISCFSNYLNSMVPSDTDEDSWNQLASRLNSGPDFSTSELFQGISQVETLRILGHAVKLSINQGDKVVRQGEMAQEAFLVLDGTFSAEIAGKNNCLRLSTFGPGDIFGEIAHLRQTPRTADVVCLSPGKVIIINDSFIDQITASAPATAIKIMKNLLQLLAGRLEKTNEMLYRHSFPDSSDEAEIFRDLQPIELTIMLDILPKKKFSANEEIFKTGDSPGSAYLVLSGELEVLHAVNGSDQLEMPVITRILPGSIVGELALIDNEKRSADVKSVINSEVYEFKTDIFEQLMHSYPVLGHKLLMNFARLIARRTRETTSRLAQALGWSSPQSSTSLSHQKSDSLDSAFNAIIENFRKLGIIGGSHEILISALRKRLESTPIENSNPLLLKMIELNILGSFAGWIDFLISEKKASRDRFDSFKRHFRQAVEFYSKQHALDEKEIEEFFSDLAKTFQEFQKDRKLS
ncbi:MAG: cyclic nucleotide-binding domain-containing protein [Candidatus Riflebacteria bacterium]|nr:cyclic nucleotide-binding domain-containing protein [Candidatus Riflebacteria bacterium]